LRSRALHLTTDQQPAAELQDGGPAGVDPPDRLERG